MKNITTVQSVYFSPKGTTRKVLETISKSIDINLADVIDLTLPKNREQWDGGTSGDLFLVGVPTYYDTIPSMILSQLNRLKGKGKWAVPVTVYGNVSPGTCLQELCGLLQKRGFKILAAATFIGEHSFANDDIPLGKGRPDEKDLTMASDFGEMIREKIDTRLIEAPVEGIQLKIGYNYTRKPEEYPEKDVVNLARVEYDESNCMRCLSCAEACPTGAIDADTLAMDDGLCTRCFACTRACPTEARKPIVIKDIIDYFQTLLDKRQEPSIFI